MDDLVCAPSAVLLRFLCHSSLAGSGLLASCDVQGLTPNNRGSLEAPSLLTLA